jgi:putative oxidoreductase
MSFARLILRASVGGLFIGHGTQKLFGWFGGHGLEATGQAFEGLGLRPGRHHAVAAGIGETAGGAALALGAATPLAAASLTATMLTAIDRVHFKNGPWVTNGGYEYNLVLIAAALAVAETGPGPLSVDRALGVERSGPRWALAALAAGIVGYAGARLVNAAEPEPAAAPAAPAEEPSPAPAAATATE